MTALRRCLLVAGFAWLIASPVAAQESWVGKTILTKRDGIKLSRTDEKGREFQDDEVVGLDADVLDDKDGRIQVKNLHSVIGWLDKTDAIPLDDAVEFFTSRIQADPKNADAYFRRGAAFLGKGAVSMEKNTALMDKADFQRAVADLTQAIRLNANFSRAYAYRALASLGQLDFASAVADSTEAIRLDPDTRDGLEARALTWLFGGRDLNRALEAYQAIIRSDPKDVGAWWKSGDIRFRLGEHEKAVANFSEALRLDPKEIGSYHGRARAWQALMQYEKALADYNEAHRLDPKDADILSRRGDVWGEKNEFGKAIADYSEALKLNPQAGHVHSRRGLAYFLTKQYEPAIQDFEQAQKIGSNLEILYCNWAWMLAICADAKYRDGTRAVELAWKGVKLASNNRCRCAMAAAYAECGQFEEAIYWQERAMRDPELRDDPAMRRALQCYRDKKPYRQQ
jgi:tetratricopeptide (TPR) repeat protein